LKRTDYCGRIDRRFLGQSVTVMGWVHRRRDHGGVIFIDLRDREGIVQVVCDPDRPATFAIAEKLRHEYCIAVTGRVRPRPAGTVNPNLRSGEIEVLAETIEILNASATPPFQLDDENLSETVRLAHRVLDLRRPQMQNNLMLRYRAAMAARRYLDAQGFVEIETPVLYKSTPEGAREFLVPSRMHHGQFYALPQSPQLFKQMLMIAGFDRYYQIVKCFRDEDLRADRQPEFTQIDLEMSFIDEEDVYALIEGLFARLFPAVGIPVGIPFPRLTWAEAMLRYGSDKPDLRFGLEIADLSEKLGASGFRGDAPVDLPLGLGHHEAHHLAELLDRGGSGGGHRLVHELVDGRLVELRGGPGRDHVALGALLVGELGAPGALERLDRLGPLLDLFAGHVADLVVGELVPQLVLLVADRRGEHPQRAHAGLVARLHRVGHLPVDLVLQRGAGH
jgi:hypothetical protein